MTTKRSTDEASLEDMLKGLPGHLQFAWLLLMLPLTILLIFLGPGGWLLAYHLWRRTASLLE